MASNQEEGSGSGSGSGSTVNNNNNNKPAKRKPVFIKVDQLKPGTNGHTLVAKVLSSNTVLYKGRPFGSASHNHLRPTLIAECLIGDETGTIIFTARNEQGPNSPPFFPSLFFLINLFSDYFTFPFLKMETFFTRALFYLSGFLAF